MGYHLTEPIAAYPEEYRRDPLFGDPSPGLDQRWIYRLRRESTMNIAFMRLTVL